MAHQFGASLVGITGVHKEFIFKNMMRGMDEWGDEVPEHWKSIIVIGIPMNWDPMYSAIGYSTSYDAYHKCRLAIGKLQIFLGELGYGSRCQVPGNDYEMTIPPLGVLAGLGEASRNGTLMTPELGTNVRLAALVTDIELEHDKPVDLGMQHFCRDCKICATSCPSGSISLSDEPDTVIRGFKRYDFNQDSCYRMWQSGPTAMGMGCRACIAVCPYTRKNNWIHTIVREADPRDKTGATRKALLAMQHNMFYYPEAEAYHGDWNGGHMAGYHQPPEWMRTENYFKVDKTGHTTVTGRESDVSTINSARPDFLDGDGCHPALPIPERPILGRGIPPKYEPGQMGACWWLVGVIPAYHRRSFHLAG